MNAPFLNKQQLFQLCFQLEELYQNSELHFHELHSYLKAGVSLSAGLHLSIPRSATSLYHTASIRRQVTRDILQAVGRICRTFRKSPEIRLYTTSHVLTNMDCSCLDTSALCPEMKALVEYAKVEPPVDELAQMECIGERISLQGSSYITRMLGSPWTDRTMELWKALRNAVLSSPLASSADSTPVQKQYYISIPHDQTCYWYTQKSDFFEVRIALSEEHCRALRTSLDLPGIYTVSEDEARLPQIMQYPGMEDYFKSNEWATEFPHGDLMLSPVLFNNIYKGALGEAAGKFVLQQELGLILQDIEEPEFFEVFDFVCNDDIYFDFKHWKNTSKVDSEKMRIKIANKLDHIHGQKVFVVQLIGDSTAAPVKTADGRIIEIPALLNEDGTPNVNAIRMIREEL